MVVSEYLHRIGKKGTTSCHHCGWECERRVLTSVVGFDLSLRAVVAAMLEEEVKWKAVASFCEIVMS
ncbi:hypothetical protein ACFW04_006603 [Cataglyphis niger]